MPKFQDDSLIKLFAESYGGLRRYVQRLVRSRETAEDIVQEAFLRTYEHGKSDLAPKAFLYSIARNLATDHHRHGRIARSVTLGDPDRSDVLPREPSVEARVLSDEQTRLLREAVARLPPQRRAVFTLKVFHACSYREIAERLGISTKTVENHVAQALRDTHAYMRRRYDHE
jgi:RNA polymerase sigma-70 factor, ECF subfamily